MGHQNIRALIQQSVVHKMKKFLVSFFLVSLMGTFLYANEFDTQVDENVEKIQKIFNSLVNSDLKKRYFNYNYPQMDVIEDTKNYTFFFALPGRKKEDITLALRDDNVLVIKGKAQKRVIQNDASYKEQEIFFGKFKRSIKLPKNIDISSLKTNFTDGILQLTINKKASQQKNLKIIPID